MTGIFRLEQIARLAQCWRSPWKVTDRERIELEDGSIVAGMPTRFTKLTPPEMWRAANTGKVAIRRMRLLEGATEWS